MTTRKSAIEIESPYAFSTALREATRCLQCFDAPCTKACPAGIVIPRFIRMILSTNVQGAGEVVRAANPLAASCGIACPDEQLCAAVCLRQEIDRPIEIRRLHRYVTEQEDLIGARRPEVPRPGRLRVAVVGAGPAGLACTRELRRSGIKVTLFERRNRVGGVLASTIPLYRFPDRVIRRDAASILEGDQGIDLRLGRTIEDVEALARSYDAVFVATGLAGAGPSLPGADLNGVSTGEEFLARSRQARYRNRVGSEPVVIGGGNVAIDAAMAIIRCGETGPRMPRVRLLYRRTRAEMPAWDREVREAERLGVTIDFLVLVDSFTSKGRRLAGVRLRKATLGPADANGRPSPVSIPGSDFVLPCDQAILAIGQRLDSGPLSRLPITRGGLLKVHPRTGRVGGKIFAGGDATNPDQTIVAAIRDGRRAARSIAATLGVRRP